MVDGITDPEKLSKMARAKLRNKIPQLRLAFEGRFEERHRFQMEELLDQLRFLDATVAEFALKIEERSRPFHDKVELLISTPEWIGSQPVAWLREIGGDMNQFPTAQHLASWAGSCPGNKKSASKQYSGKTRKGSRWLRRILCPAAWAAFHTKNTYLAAQFRRIAAKRGKQRAIIAVAHSISGGRVLHVCSAARFIATRVGTTSKRQIQRRYGDSWSRGWSAWEIKSFWNPPPRRKRRYFRGGSNACTLNQFLNGWLYARLRMFSRMPGGSG